MREFLSIVVERRNEGSRGFPTHRLKNKTNSRRGATIEGFGAGSGSRSRHFNRRFATSLACGYRTVGCKPGCKPTATINGRSATTRRMLRMSQREHPPPFASAKLR